MRRFLLLAILVLLLVGGGCGSSGQEPLVTSTGGSPSSQLATIEPKGVKPETFYSAGLGIVAPIVPVKIKDGALTPPPNPSKLGWWGRKANAPSGVTLLTGHTVHTGGGALDDLEQTRKGSIIFVSGVRYGVRTTQVRSTSWVADHAQALFAQTGPHRLVVVTCEDYDRNTGTYASNVIVIAYPTERK